MPERRGLGRWVAGTTLRYPVLAVLLLALVLAWRGAVPARPPAAARTVPRRAKEEFVLSLADIKLRAGRHRAAARALIEAHRARLEAGAADEEDSAALTRLAARVERAEPFGEAELRTVANEARALGRAREEART